MKQIFLANFGATVLADRRGLFSAICYAHGVVTEEIGGSVTLILDENTVTDRLFQDLRGCLLILEAEQSLLLRADLSSLSIGRAMTEDD